jgi:hypothetical protein
MASGSKWMRGVLGALIGMAGAFACSTTRTTSGPKLPTAGSSSDDGTGMLAAWSRGGGRGQHSCTGEDCEDGNGYGGYYGDDYYDGYYGNDYYGYYGGDIYGYGGGYYGGGYGYGYGYYNQQYIQPPQPTDAYSANNVLNGGTIEGTVTWKNAPATPATVTSSCDRAVPNPTLQRTSTGGVGNTLVYLADISFGKVHAALGGTLEQRGCTLSPHMQLAAPIGVVMQIANQDTTPQNLLVRPVGDGAERRDSKIELSLGSMKIREVPLLYSGIYQVTSEENPAGLAWIVVPRHPYYAITDSDGHFRLDDVPPGEYTLVAWHEPVAAPGESGKETGDLSGRTPIELRMKVKVTPGQVTPIAVDLK